MENLTLPQLSLGTADLGLPRQGWRKGTSLSVPSSYGAIRTAVEEDHFTSGVGNYGPLYKGGFSLK